MTRKLNLFEVLDSLSGAKEIARGRWTATCVLCNTPSALFLSAASYRPFTLECAACRADFRDLIVRIASRAVAR
jgi:hypothetical protein